MDGGVEAYVWPQEIIEDVPVLSTVQQAEVDLYQAVGAIAEIMALDKGPSEEEWVEWCNRHLKLVQRYGLKSQTVEFF